MGRLDSLPCKRNIHTSEILSITSVHIQLLSLSVAEQTNISHKVAYIPLRFELRFNSTRALPTPTPKILKLEFDSGTAVLEVARKLVI